MEAIKKYNTKQTFSELLYDFSCRIPRPNSAPQKGYITPDTPSNYCRLMSTTYAHHLFKQEFYDRSYDITRNHGYSQLPSSQPTGIKQEPREFTFDNGMIYYTCSVTCIPNVS